MNDVPSLTFALGEDIDMLRDSLANFAAKEIASSADEIDETDQFPMGLCKKFGDLGVHGMTVFEKYGGANVGYTAHMVAMEEISRVSASVGLLYDAHSIRCVILGGNRYINEYPVGRLWRDAKLYEIGAGMSEIRRMLIGRELFAETA